MKLQIRLARISDLKAYTDMLQRTYQKVYTNNKLGLPKELFSKKIFNMKGSQDYLKSNLKNNKDQKAWLAFVGFELVGSVSIIKEHSKFELRGFYVSTKFQNGGIGKTLWKKTLKFAKGAEIYLMIYAHNKKSISIYKKWGFKVDKEKGATYIHWSDWPKGVKAKCIYMSYNK